MGPTMSFDCGCECFSQSYSKSSRTILAPKALNLRGSPERDSNSRSSTGLSNKISSNDSLSMSPVKFSVHNFVVQKQIGKGASGKVLLVTKKNDKLNSLYAMKILRKMEVYGNNQLQNIKIEKQVLATSRSPFVVSLYHSFQTPTKIYFVMEFLPGGDLFHLLRKRKSFDMSTARFFLQEVLMALEYLHQEHRLIYRDLKPENILLQANGHIKVTDFGLAKNLAENCMSFVGTPEYAAPEILKNLPQSAAVDIWSCGVLLYEMLTGTTPFASKTQDFVEVQRKIVEETVNFPKKFDETARDFIEKALEKDAEKRISLQEAKNHRLFAGVDWEKVKVLGYAPPFSLKNEKICKEDARDLKESYDVNSFPDLEGLSFNCESKNLKEMEF